MSHPQNKAELNPYIAGGRPIPPWSRVKLLNQAMAGSRILYLLGLAAMVLEAFFTFAGPLIIKVAIDSVLDTQAPHFPAPLDLPARWLLGPTYEGGGLIPFDLPPSTDGTWALRPVLRAAPWILALAFLSSYLFQAVLGFMSGWAAQRSAENAAKALRDRLHRHVLGLPWETMLRAQTGDWLQRCTSDVDTTRRFLAIEVFEIIRTLVLVAVALPVMLTLSPGLTLWGSLVVPIIIAFSLVFFIKVQKTFLSVDQQEGVLAGIIQENITGVRVVRAFARQARETERFSQANTEFRERLYKLIVYLAWYWGVSSGLGLVQLAIVLSVGATMVAGGAITVGILVLFMTYEQQILWPIRQLGRLLADSGKVKVALGRMSEILALEPEPMSPGLPCLAGDLEFDHVSFSYPDGTPVLHDVSFRLDAGQTLAILGPTGSGKTTLVHLILRLYEPTAGRILLGGVDLRLIDKGDLRQKVAMVLQESFVFGTTVRENIHLGRPGVALDEMQAAARAAHLHQTIEALDQGYETGLGERGVSLSGGQRQRLALSRALVRRSPYLILDDSLSAVDNQTDAQIQRHLKEHQATTIIIAHRMTTLAKADRILVLEHGRVSDLGTHQELVSREGLYRRLCELQGELEENEAV